MFEELQIQRQNTDNDEMDEARQQDIVITKIQKILSSKYGFDLNQMLNWGTDYEEDPDHYQKNFQYRQNRNYMLDQCTKLRLSINLNLLQGVGLMYAIIDNIQKQK